MEDAFDLDSVELLSDGSAIQKLIINVNMSCYGFFDC